MYPQVLLKSFKVYKGICSSTRIFSRKKTQNKAKNQARLTSWRYRELVLIFLRLRIRHFVVMANPDLEYVQFFEKISASKSKSLCISWKLWIILRGTSTPIFDSEPCYDFHNIGKIRVLLNQQKVFKIAILHDKWRRYAEKVFFRFTRAKSYRFCIIQKWEFTIF